MSINKDSTVAAMAVASQWAFSIDQCISCLFFFIAVLRVGFS